MVRKLVSVVLPVEMCGGRKCWQHCTLLDENREKSGVCLLFALCVSDEGHTRNPVVAAAAGALERDKLEINGILVGL